MDHCGWQVLQSCSVLVTCRLPLPSEPCFEFPLRDWVTLQSGQCPSGAPLSLKSNPNFLPIWLSLSLQWELDPQKPLSPGPGFMLDSFRLPEILVGAQSGTKAWILPGLGPPTLRPALNRAFQAEEQPAGKGTTDFRTNPELEMVVGSTFASPSPEWWEMMPYSFYVGTTSASVSKPILGSQLSWKN